MNPNPTPAPADPVLLALLGGWLIADALLTLARLLLIPAAALLLTLAGWRPRSCSRAAAPPAAATPPPPALLPAAPSAAPLERLRVVELRALARAAGLPQLARSGRRAQLLEALAAAC